MFRRRTPSVGPFNGSDMVDSLCKVCSKSTWSATNDTRLVARSYTRPSCNPIDVVVNQNKCSLHFSIVFASFTEFVTVHVIEFCLMPFFSLTQIYKLRDQVLSGDYCSYYTARDSRSFFSAYHLHQVYLKASSEAKRPCITAFVWLPSNVWLCTAASDLFIHFNIEIESKI